MTRQAHTGDLMWPRLFRRLDGGSRTLQGQLRDMLVHAVMEGFLSPGEALPSNRLLSELLGLSRTTVTLVLQALTDKGLIVGRPHSGEVRFFKRPFPFPMAPRTGHPTRVSRSLGAGLAAAGRLRSVAR